MLQSDVNVQCTDCLDCYRYDLLLNGEIVSTRTSEDHFREAAIIINNGQTEMDLFETKVELLRRYQEQFADPNFIPVTIIRN